MKIAFISLEYPPFIWGGAGIYAMNITKELAQMGHEIVVFAPYIGDNVKDHTSDDHTSEPRNIKIKRLFINKKFPSPVFQFWLKLPKEIKKGDFDIIHFNGLSYGFFKTRFLNVPHILTINHLVIDTIKKNELSFGSRLKLNMGDENSFLMSIIEKRAIKTADKIISISEFTKKRIVKSYNVDPDKVNVIYLGINKSKEKFKINPKQFKEIKKLPNKKIILFVGRINDPRKGLDILINAFRKVLDEIDAILVVLGEGDKTKFVEISKELGLCQNIFFMGYVDDDNLNKYYQSCDVYVCPSRLEGFGLTILEALLNGAPVIASKVGSIPEIIKDGKNGLLVDANDTELLSNAICSILKDKDLSEKINSNNNPFETFNWIKCAQETEELYNSIKGEK